MVNGVHGHVSRVVGHVVVEQRIVLESVIILHVPVEESIVLAQIIKEDYVQTFALLVRIINML